MTILTMVKGGMSVRYFPLAFAEAMLAALFTKYRSRDILSIRSSGNVFFHHTTSVTYICYGNAPLSAAHIERIHAQSLQVTWNGSMQKRFCKMTHN